MAGWELPDGPVTIMFTDVEGSTALHTRLGDEAGRRIMREIEESVRGALPAHGGHEVKSTGDGHLVWFASARRAVSCAIAIQRALHDAPVRVRIGLSAGEVTEEAGDLFGEAVNLAARVMDKADGGEVLVAEVVRSLTGRLPDGEYREKGRFKLKGIAERMRLFAVEWAPAAAADRPPPAATPFVGRRAERDAIAGVLGRISSGRGGTVFVEGEAGIGKTRLVAEIADTARARGIAVLRGVAADLDRTQPFRAIADALGVVRGSEDPRRRAIADLLKAGPNEVSGYQVEQACVELVESLALAAPLLLVVEDLHWADPPTLQVLHSLDLSTTDLPLVVVATLRPSPRPPELRTLIERLTGAGALHVELAPLSGDEQRELAAAVGANVDDGFGGKLDSTAGNPLYVIELAKAAVSGSGDELPSTLRSTIIGGLRHLPEPTMEALRIAAVLGSAFSVTDLATASSASAVSLVPVLRPALDAHVLYETGAGLAFRHDLIRESLYAELPAAVRKALHAEIGRALADAGADAGVVAAHLGIGAEPGDEAAVEWIAAAAKEASRRSLTAGIELLEQALALCGPLERRRDELEIQLVELLAWAGRGEEAFARARTTLARAPARDIDRAMRVALGSALLTNARPEEAAAVGREALQLDLEDDERARFLLLAHYLQPSEEAVAAAREARALAEAAGDELTVALSYLVEAFPYSWAHRWADLDDMLTRALDLFARIGSPAAERYRLHVLAWRAWNLGQRGQREEARLVRREARRRAEELGVQALALSFLTDEAIEAFTDGRIEEAMAMLAAVVASQRERGVTVGDGALFHAYLALLTGAPDAEALIAELHDEHDSGVFLRAIVEIERGDPGRGLDLLLAEFAKAEAAGWGWPADIASPPMIRAGLATGRVAEVEPVVRSAETAAARADATPGARLTARWLRALFERDAPALGALLSSPDADDWPVPRSFTLEDLGDIHAEHGDRAAARAAYEDALTAYDELGFLPSGARVTAKLREMGVRRGARGARTRATTGWDAVTPTEHKVVDLVAKGMTNPQIAKELYVSRHTVDSHLKHVYAKLGISSRVELAAAVARRAS